MSVLVDPTHLMYDNKWQHALMRSDAGDWYLNNHYLTPPLRKQDLRSTPPIHPIWTGEDEIFWKGEKMTIAEIVRMPDFHWRYVRYHPLFLGKREAIHTTLVTWRYLKDIYALEPRFVQYVFDRALERRLGSRQGVDKGLFAKAMLSVQIRFVARHFGDYWKVFWGVNEKLHKWMHYSIDITTPAGISVNGGIVSEQLARQLFPHYPRMERYYWTGKKLYSKGEVHDDDVSTDGG